MGAGAGAVGVGGGELLEPKPRAFRRAASPGEGLRGWRKEAFADDDERFGLRVSVVGAEGDGLDDGGREEFSLTGFGY